MSGLSKLRQLAVLVFLTTVSSQVAAEQLWSDASLSYLQGSHYEVGDSDRQVMTFEHSSQHNWGDTFFFVDYTRPDHGDKDTYFELSPRLSLSYLSGQSLKTSFIKDVYLAGQMEGSPDFTNFPYGIGFSLNVPKFNYFNVNLYKVNNEHKQDDEQVTITWGLPFSLGQADFLYDGFVDAATSQSDHAAETNFTSQLKWNVGKQFFHSKKPLYLGLEYTYWKNKFGLDGVKESNPSVLLKAHF